MLLNFNPRLDACISRGGIKSVHYKINFTLPPAAAGAFSFIRGVAVVGASNHQQGFKTPSVGKAV